MKKISILMYSFSSGGAERVVSILSKELAKRYEIHLILMNDSIFYEIPKGVKLHFLEKSNPNENGIKKLLKIPFLAFKYVNFLKKNKIDISISFLSRPNYISILSKIFGFKKRIIINERTTFSKWYNKGFSAIINKNLVKLYNFADFLVTNSKGNYLDLKENFNIKIPHKIIYNPINLELIDKLKNETFEIQKDKFTFVTVGRLDKGKNQKLLIEAMKNIDANLWIIGDGELREDLEFRINELQIRDKVKLLGRQKNPFKFLNKADCFVFSSNYEGFPNALLEALACELPIISTDCLSGPREILAPNTEYKNLEDIELAEYGILTTINDVENLKKAMKLIMENDNLRSNYKQKALKRAKDFEVDKIIKEWIAVIDSNRD